MSIATDPDTRTLVEPVRPFARLGRDDVDYAGGKGANLGELDLRRAARARRLRRRRPGLCGLLRAERRCASASIEILADIDIEDRSGSAGGRGGRPPGVARRAGAPGAEGAIVSAYRDLWELVRRMGVISPVAVRSSATAEDTAAASFAGMNETFLNIRGRRRGDRSGANAAGVRCSARAPSTTGA